MRPQPATAAVSASSIHGLRTARERWLTFRNTLLASSRFQRFASRFPLTRFIARRRARRLFDLTAGFVYSQVLFACVELGLFDRLARGACDIDVLAADMRLTPQRLRLLLSAAESLELIELGAGSRVSLGQLGAVMAGNRGLASMVAHHHRFYQDLSNPVTLLRDTNETHLSRYWGYANTRRPEQLVDDDVAEYSDLMGASQEMVAQDIFDAYPMHRHARLLDLAGGDGTFALNAATRYPDLSVTTFDLPAVARRAASRFADSPARDRLRAVGGDVFRDELPGGVDIVSLVRVLHDHDDAAAAQIVARARSVLSDGGVLVIAEPMSGTPGSAPVTQAYFAFYLLAMGSGRPRSREELTKIAENAGFRRVREVSTGCPMMVRVLVAET